jgi:CelD/BcsL family acetyltransferase involved in cellulose biosynthesis
VLAGAKLTAAAIGQCPLVDLPSSFEEFLARRRQRRLLLKHMRQMERAEISVDVANADIGTQLGELFLRFHLSRFPTSRFREPQTAAFVRQVLPDLWHNNHVLAVVAKHRGDLIGLHLYMRSTTAIGGYNGGFEPQYDKAGLGTLMILGAFRHAIEAKLASVNLFRGCAPYKMRWASSVNRLLLFGIEAPSGNAMELNDLLSDFPPPS